MVGISTERLRCLDELYPTWENCTIWEHFERSAKRFPENDFLIYEDRTFSYDEIRTYALEFSENLAALGVGPETHVAVRLNNCPEYVCMILALARIGAVKIPVNICANAEELSYILEKAEAEYFFTDEWKKYPEWTFHNGIRKVIAVGYDGTADKRMMSFTDFRKNRSSWKEQKIDPFAMSDIMFTSGSTSHPKGVVMTHDMVVRSGYATARTRMMEPGRRICVPIPLYHAFAYIEGLMAAITVGGALILFREHFQSERTLRLMREKKANDVICVSAIMIDILVKGDPHPEDYPAMHAAYWASACPEWTWQKARDAFGITDVGTGYGMTECGSTATLIRPTDEPDRVSQCHGRLKLAGAAGKTAYGNALLEMKLVDAGTGNVVEPGTEGIIYLRGVTMTPGYYEEPEINKDVYRDGWFCTGDIGVQDHDGYLKFLGRNNDMYKINGENVSPQFIETVLSRHEKVQAVEVVGIDHPKYGAVGVAFVDTDADPEMLEPELRIYAKEHLALFQCPGYYIFLPIDQWPRTGTGKISKKELRKLAVQVLKK